ncbi:hypothetical protein PQX77_011102 [Marasmius sp. AFHP31]|nr:hypothetical protein PQX77_011102 [Marasmius sp. AFHP31]
MLNLKMHFGNDLFNGSTKDFKLRFKPAMEGVAKASDLWENLIGEEKDTPYPIDLSTTITNEEAKTETTTSPPTWFRLRSGRKDMQPGRRTTMSSWLMMTRTAFDPIKHLTVADVWVYVKDTYGGATLSNIYGDFLKSITLTIDQNSPLSLIAKLCTYFEHLPQKVHKTAFVKADCLRCHQAANLVPDPKKRHFGKAEDVEEDDTEVPTAQAVAQALIAAAREDELDDGEDTHSSDQSSDWTSPSPAVPNFVQLPSGSRIPHYTKVTLEKLFNYPPPGLSCPDLGFYWKGGLRDLEEEAKDLDTHEGVESHLEVVGINMPEVVKAPILVQATPKVWEAAAFKCLHDYTHMENINNTASSKSGSSSSSSRSSKSSVADPDSKKLPLTLDCIQNAIMVEYERLNPQFAGCLTAVKYSGTNTPLFQQQRPRSPQRQ